ncbi:MAG TPA: hypothetical protein VK578_11170 [Edaphobacter sp.]|nr:hypothetical protein [Edaphobacter sp.]
MNNLLLAAPESTESAAGHGELTEAQGTAKQMVLDSVTSPNTRRSYSLTLDELFAFSAGRSLTPWVATGTESLNGCAGTLDYQCEAFSCPETYRRGPARRLDLRRGCR